MDSKVLAGIILFILLTGLSGCNQPANPAQTPTPEPTETSELTPQPITTPKEEPEAPLETKARVLVIGEPALGTIELLESSSDILEFEIVKQESLDNNSKNKFGSIDLILLDQSGSDKKELFFRPRKEIAEWVWNGEKRKINAVLKKADIKHSILEGFEASDSAIEITAVPVAPRGTEIISLKNSQSSQLFPEIVEKSRDKGRSIYFNFSLGKTPRLFRNTIRYLME